MDKLNIAVIQMSSGLEKEVNIEQAAQSVRNAAKQGADLVVLPEYFNFLGHKTGCLEAAESIPGYTTDRMRDVARKVKVGLLCGSIPERADKENKIRNSSVFISHKGDILCKYSKIHLFDINVPGEVSYMESAYIEAGKEVITFPWQGIHFGIAICYDLRFPELFRCLMQQGAEVILVPASFTHATGRYHWRSLVRARAIENQVFMCAANQWGEGTSWLPTFGHSAIIDPWGRTLCELPNEIGIGLAEIDIKELHRIRSESPILTHIQPWLFSALNCDAKTL